MCKYPMPKNVVSILTFAVLLTFVGCSVAGENAVSGWLNWRGPHQNGTSDETNLPETWAVGGENNLWTRDIPGQSAPVVANGKVYIMGMKGENDSNLQEGLFCLDAATGKTIWDRCYNDFISDTIYLRYASSAPCVDPETGNIFTLGSQGFMTSYDPDGKVLWQRSMMDSFGFMTFPNGRTGRPVIEGPLVIVACTTANWGASGPAASRWYAFDKKTGDLVWQSNTESRPKENTFSTPIIEWVGNKRMMYVCGGDGNLYGINSHTGETLWIYPMCKSGMSSTVITYKGMVIAVHGRENLDISKLGRMVCLKIPEGTDMVDGKPKILDKSVEVWRCDVQSFASSPVLAGDKIYISDDQARLCCVDVNTGKLLWRKDLKSVEVVFSSIVYADGKLFVPVLSGEFYIIKPGDTEETTQILSKVKLDAKCCGAPAVCDGHVYIQSGLQMDGKLYCIAKKDVNQKAPAWPAAEVRAPGPVAKYIGVPADILAHPGQGVPLRLLGVDKDGLFLPENPDDAKKATWARYIPPTAKVKAEINGNVVDGVFKAEDKPIPSAGALKAELNGKIGITRGRIIPNLPIRVSFEKMPLQPSLTDPTVQFAYPPLPWLGARFRLEIREKDGAKVLYKTTDNRLFQRAMTFIGTEEMHDYTVQADVESAGEKKKFLVKMSEVGVVCQRYIVILKGGKQEMEINSNFERIRVAVPFSWKPDEWYTIKARVDVDAATGGGTVRGKAWKKGDPEPEKWTIEVPLKSIQKNGSPGIFVFAPQDVPAYIDHIQVTPNN